MVWSAPLGPLAALLRSLLSSPGRFGGAAADASGLVEAVLAWLGGASALLASLLVRSCEGITGPLPLLLKLPALPLR